MFKDPVCCMMVDERTAKFVSEPQEGKKARRFTSALPRASNNSAPIQGNMAIEGNPTFCAK
jgi:hypothetical protein